MLKISEIVRGINRYVMARLHSSKHQAHKRRSESAKKAWRTRKARAALEDMGFHAEQIEKIASQFANKEHNNQAPWAKDHAESVKQGSGAERR